MDYASISQLAKEIKRSPASLIAQDPKTDPFFAGRDARLKNAEWFAEIWRQYGQGSHLRRIHYRLISQPPGTIVWPHGRQYQNTDTDWAALDSASLGARYLDLIPFDCLPDNRNEEAIINASRHLSPAAAPGVTCSLLGAEFNPRPALEMPYQPTLVVNGLDRARQDYVVEIWIEKSGENDWLVPLCHRRGVNLLVGTGEQSEKRCRELATRAAEYAVPTRVLYISDFDPGGRSMPKAAARKAEFTIHKFGLDVDLQIIPIALTPEQISQYDLPKMPLKDKQRKDAFETIFGVGATELDALEALHPGEFARIVETEIDKWLDPSLAGRMQSAWWEQKKLIKEAEDEIVEAHREEIDELDARLSEIDDTISDWETDTQELWDTITEELEEERKTIDLSHVEVPTSEAPGETDSFVLYDSTRDYLTQMDHYNKWREGDE